MVYQTKRCARICLDREQSHACATCSKLPSNIIIMLTFFDYSTIELRSATHLKFALMDKRTLLVHKLVLPDYLNLSSRCKIRNIHEENPPDLV